MPAASTAITVATRSLKLTNLDKVLFPNDGYTKGELIAYYRSIAPWLLPHVTERPLTLQRFPDGIDGPSFFEKQAPRGVPEWARTVTVASEHGRSAQIAFLVCDDEATLTYVANLAAITLHVWTSRIGSLETPDYALFDLDPWEGCTVGTLANVALAFRDSLREIGLEPLVKSTGGSGLHVVLPLAPRYGYDVVKAFGELIARRVAVLLPRATTLERATAKRKPGTVYLDYVQVGKGKTIVPPFSVRARPKAPVSMPLQWADVEALARKRGTDTAREFARWTIENVPGMLRRAGDPWGSGAWREQRLEPALKRARTVWQRM